MDLPAAAFNGDESPAGEAGRLGMIVAVEAAESIVQLNVVFAESKFPLTYPI